MKKYLNEGYLGLFLGVLAFLYFLHSGLTKEKITSNNDLREIRGNYLRHSFKDNTGFKNMGYEYYIWAEPYTNAFQIKADYLKLFNSQTFLSRVNKGDKIIFTIPKRQIEKLNSDEKVFVTSIEIEGRTYLNKNIVLEIEKDLATSIADYFIGSVYLIAGLFVYFRRRLKLVKVNAKRGKK